MTTALQTALYDALTSDTALMALVEGVYDIAPTDSAYPYITIGADAIRNSPTKSNNGLVVTTSLSVWSHYDGRTEAKTLIAELVRVLDGATLSGAVSCHYLDSLVRLISRERIVEGVARFRIRLS